MTSNAASITLTLSSAYKGEQRRRTASRIRQAVPAYRCDFCAFKGRTLAQLDAHVFDVHSFAASPGDFDGDAA